MRAAAGDFIRATRSVARAPMLATVVVVSLGVGIGVNTVVFTWIQTVVLRPVPGVRNASRLHQVEWRTETGSYPGVSWPEYRDLRERLPSFGGLLAFRMAPFNVGEPGRTRRVYGLLVSDTYFSALGLRPALGRFPDHGEAAADSVVVISHTHWRVRFGGSPGVVGRSLRVNGRLLRIVGVAPERFQGTSLGLEFDIWVPAALGPELFGSGGLQDRASRGYTVLGMLKAGSTRQQAQHELNLAATTFASSYAETNANLNGEVLAFWSAPRGPQRMLAGALVVLQGTMMLLLGAVCGNTATLLFVRTSARTRELGIRLALGAGRHRVVSLLIFEALVLATAGSLLGVVVAMWGTNALRAVPSIGGLPIRFQTELDVVSLVFAAGLGIAAAVLSAAAPAWAIGRTDPQQMLRAGSRASGRSGVRNGLMAVEVALAAAVLIAAGMFLRGFSEARGGIDPGFRREGVLLGAYDLAGSHLRPLGGREFARRLLERVAVLPGVEAAAIAASVPLDIHGLPQRSFSIDGRMASGAAPSRAATNIVTPGYFRTMGIPLVAGRDFDSLAESGRLPQVVVNEAFVSRYVEQGEAVGRRIESRGTTYVITGVAATTVSDAFGEPATPVIYFSYRDSAPDRGEIHIRARGGNEMLLAPAVERIVRELDPWLPIHDVRTLAEHIDKNLFLLRVPARMFVVLGPALLMLAGIGIYAVVAYSVSQRTTEIGVRLALGATGVRVVTDLVADTLRVITAGLAVGCGAALVLSLSVGGRFDPWVFAAVPLLLLALAAGACWLPARRAAALDPVEALRER